MMSRLRMRSTALQQCATHPFEIAKLVKCNEDVGSERDVRNFVVVVGTLQITGLIIELFLNGQIPDWPDHNNDFGAGLKAEAFRVQGSGLVIMAGRPWEEASIRFIFIGLYERERQPL